LEITVRHNPALAVARVALGPNETCRAEGGAMMATSGGVTVEARAQGGFMKALKRKALGGESFFMTTYTAPAAGGWVDCTAALPGDVTAIEVDAAGLNLTKGAYLCSASTVEIETEWGGFKNLAGGEGGFLLRAGGSGPVAAACYGALDVVELSAGEQLVLDSGHLVAFSDGVSYETRMVAKGLMQTVKSSEGLVFEFTGPGRVWMQSRNKQDLVGWLTDALPFTQGD
jgi:uncharacterized protein (TIGR00266 family)